jgi:hypothetical protein
MTLCESPHHSAYGAFTDFGGFGDILLISSKILQKNDLFQNKNKQTQANENFALNPTYIKNHADFRQKFC